MRLGKRSRMEIILCVHVHPLIYLEQVRSFENGLHKNI